MFSSASNSIATRLAPTNRADALGVRGWTVLAGLFVMCLVPRAIMAWRLPGLCPDAVLYIDLAKAIEAGQLQTALGNVRFNIFPLILSYLHQAGLPWETAGAAWGVLISSCTVLPLFGWLRRAFDQQVAVTACILYAIHAGMIRWSVEIIRDPTFWFLMTAAIYFLWRAVAELRWAWYAVAGFAIALACMTRFEGIFLIVPIGAWSWRKKMASVDNFSRRRLLGGGLLCLSIYPALMAMIYLTWYRGLSATDIVRTEPMMLAQDWAQETLGGERSAEKKKRTDLLAPLPIWKMAERFATGMAKGFTPLYFLAALGGMVLGKRALAQRDYRPIIYLAGSILLAIWVHLYWSHEAGQRYFFPVVIVTLPFVAIGFLQISTGASMWFRKLHRPATARAAGLAPYGLLLAVNLMIAFGSDYRPRAASVDVGRWVHQSYGPTARIFGPDGETQVVNYYAHGRCESFPEIATVAAVMKRIRKSRPDVVLLPTDERTPERNSVLQSRVEALGFAPVDRVRFGFNKSKVLVLARS